MEKLRLKIDGLEVEGTKGQTVLETAMENGIRIPTLCYDSRLEVCDSCGICVVEVEGMPELLRSCSAGIVDGMAIWTDTPKIRESRRAVLERLLSRHTGDCRAPCVMACPAQTDCQGYVGLIANGRFEEALGLIKDSVPLAASIGRVCPHPCEDACRRRLIEEPVSILNLKRFAADVDLGRPEPYLPEIAPTTGKNVSIVGGGPGGLSCAYYLARKGHSVTVYDMMPKMGGMLRYGIPEYRLPKAIIEKEAALIGKMGVKFNNNVRVGQDISFDSLKKNSDAVVVAVGAWKSLPLRLPGAELSGVYGGIEFLRKTYMNEPVTIGRNVAVIGGGNTAIDVSRTAVRLGAEKVCIIYRRTRAEMPAEEAEIIEAEEEGVIFKYLVSPIEIVGENGKVAKLRLQAMRPGEPDESGRRMPVAVEGEEEMLAADTVIAALGQGIAPEGFDGIGLTGWNTIIVDDNMFTTSEKGVFAIGDCVNDGASVAIEAIGHAKKAAEAIDGFLRGVEISRAIPYRVSRDNLTADDFTNYKKEPRAQARYMNTAERVDSFFETSETLDEAAAVKEASRCIECGCHDYFECKLIALADELNAVPECDGERAPYVEFKENHPFIARDPNKCIECGLCVRACEELIGTAALGHVERGVVTPAPPPFEVPLSETKCVACGQCVYVCPTGALQERNTFKKPTPLKTEKTQTICGMCAIGCPICIESYGNLIVKATPVTGGGISDGVLCGRGRFGISYIQRDGRITTPLIRKSGVLTPVSWHDAFNYTAKKMQGIRMRGFKTAVSIGHTYSIEDTGAILNLAKLLDSNVFSFACRENGLASILGFDGTPNTLDEIDGSGAILVFGSSMMNNPVIVSKLRRAAENGASVTVVGSGGSLDLPCGVIDAVNSTSFIKQAVRALIDAGCEPDNADGFEELKTSLSKITVDAGAKAFAEKYKSATKAMIIFSLEEISTAAAAELANMAVIAGHIGSPGNGICMLRQMVGSQALADFKITATAETARDAKGLMIFGEDPAAQSPSPLLTRTIRVRPQGVEFMMVQDTHMTETAKSADAVFPLAAYPEICGTFVDAQRRLRQSAKAVPPPFEYTTTEIAQGIAEVLEGFAPEGSAAALYPDAKPGDRCAVQDINARGFGFPGGKARLQVVAEAAMFEAPVQTNALKNAITVALPRPK